jgi:hypothetical protein
LGDITDVGFVKIGLGKNFENGFLQSRMHVRAKRGHMMIISMMRCVEQETVPVGILIGSSRKAKNRLSMK